MEWTEQYEIIKKNCDAALRQQGKAASLAGIAELLGVSVGKVQAWARGQRPHADDLETMAHVLGLNPAWLLLGEGEPVPGQRKGQRFTATNAKKQLIGDLLHEALAYLDVGPEEFAKALRATPEQAEEILASRRKPTWDELLRIHTAYHVDIHFLLTGEGYTFAPHNLLTRLCTAIGVESWNTSALASACRCEKEEMKTWLAEWKKGRQPLFPPGWMAALVEQYSVDPSWLYKGHGKSHLSAEEVQRQVQSSGYGVREPRPSHMSVQEQQGQHPDPKPAVGDDTV